MEKNISVRYEEVQVTGWNGSKVEVSLTNAESEEVLENFTVEDILKHFEKSELLDAIGQDEAMDYWNLVELPQD